MPSTSLFTTQNTSFDKQQNPFEYLEFPCDKEYTQLGIGACAYFLLLEYPTDVRVYVSMNPERKNAVLVDNRNTGFRITDVYSELGIPANARNAYIWTEGITRLTDKSGGVAKIRIVTSSLYSFEILNNSSINSISSIAEIGKINSIGGYPAVARVKTEAGMGANDIAKLNVLDMSAKTFFKRGKQYTFTFEMKVYGDLFASMTTNSGNFQMFCGIQGVTGNFLFIATANKHSLVKGTAGGIFLDIDSITGSLQLSGDYILDNLIMHDEESGKSALIISTQGVFLPAQSSFSWSGQIAYYES